MEDQKKYKKIDLLYGFLEVIQYSIIFALIAFPFAKIIDLYSDFLDKGKSLIIIIIEVIIQIGLAGGGVFIVQEVGKKVPFIANLWDKHLKNHYSTKTDEVINVASAVGLITVFFVVQNNLINKLTFISKKISL